MKKVGQAAMATVAKIRGMASFEDLADFAARVDPKQLNRMQLENLTRAGAFDSIDSNRARVFAACETILRRAQAQAEEKGSGQIAGAAAHSRHSGLGKHGPAGLRGRGDRLSPDLPPA